MGHLDTGQDREGVAGGGLLDQGVANNLAMLSLDIADDELAQHAKAQARVIKAKLADLVTEAGIVPTGEAAKLAEHLYIVWSGAVLAWAIDGEGSREAWIRQRIVQALPSS